MLRAKNEPYHNGINTLLIPHHKGMPYFKVIRLYDEIVLALLFLLLKFMHTFAFNKKARVARKND